MATFTRTRYFPVYEQEDGATIKYYVCKDMRIAVKRGSGLYYLHGDHVSSTLLQRPLLRPRPGDPPEPGHPYPTSPSLGEAPLVRRSDRESTGGIPDWFPPRAGEG